MKQNIFRKVSRFVPVLVAAVAVTGCDAHIDVPDTAVRPGHVLCEDGTALSYTEYQQSGKKAVAVVFDTRQHEGAEGNGYAVYLWDITPQAFADSLGIAQGTAHLRTSRHMTAMPIHSLYMKRRKRLRRWRKRSLTSGVTGRAHTFRRWHRCVCYILSGKR